MLFERKLFDRNCENRTLAQLNLSGYNTIWHSTRDQTISKESYGVLNSSNKWTKILSWVSRENGQDSEFRSFFGRIEAIINCFRDLLTFICSELHNKISNKMRHLLRTCTSKLKFDWNSAHRCEMPIYFPVGVWQAPVENSRFHKKQKV